MRKKYLFVGLGLTGIVSLILLIFAYTLIPKKGGPITDYQPPEPTPTLSPIPTTPFTGVDDENNQKYLEDHPELTIEAQLQAKVPLTLDGFILDYSYEQDKFLVKLYPPRGASKVLFDTWMKETGLTDLSRFIIMNN